MALTKVKRRVLSSSVPTITSFTEGGTVEAPFDFFLDANNDLWKYEGELPHNVEPNTIPSLPDWIKLTGGSDSKRIIHFSAFGGKDGRNDGLHKVAHDFCNDNNLILSYQGMYLDIVDRDIIVKRPVIFECEITVTVNNSNKGKNVFSFSEARWFDIDLDLNYKEYSSRPFSNPSQIPVMSFVRWRPTIQHTNGKQIAIQEVCVHTSDGATIGKTFSDFTGKVLGGYRKISHNVYEFNNLKVNINDTTEQTGSGYFSVFKLSDLDNVYINNFTLGDQSPVANPKAIFDIGGCYGVFIHNTKSTGIYSLNAATYGYIYNIWNSINVNFSNIAGNVVTKNWWSLYGANCVKVINHRDSHFYRYDNHSFVQDVFSENCTTRGSALSGNGFRRYVNCDFIFSSDENSGNLFYLRGLSQNGNYNSFNGDIHISGGSVSGNPVDFYFVNASALGNADSLNNKIFNSFKMDNVDFSRLQFTGSFYILPYRDMNRDLFRELKVSNITFPFKLSGLARSESSFTQSDTEAYIEFENVKFFKPSNYQEILSKRYETAAHFPSNTKARIVFKDCEYVGCWSSNCSMEFIGSSINSARNTTQAVSDYFSFKGCTILDIVLDGFLLSKDKIFSEGTIVNGSSVESSNKTELYKYLEDAETSSAVHIVANKIYPKIQEAKLYAQPYTSFYVKEDTGVYFKLTKDKELVKLN